MNPLFIPPKDTPCPICLNEASDIHVKWHSHGVTQRPHSACLDCALVLIKDAYQSNPIGSKTLSCPECRKIVHIKTLNDAPKLLLVTMCMVSALFVFSKGYVEPNLVRAARLLLPATPYSHLVDLWTTGSLYHTLSPQIELAIEQVILGLGKEIIVSDLMNFLSTSSTVACICLLAIYVSSINFLNSRPLPIDFYNKATRIVFLQIGMFFFYNIFTEEMALSHLREKKHQLDFVINPIKINPLSIIGHALVAAAPLVIACHLKTRTVPFDLENTDSLKNAIMKKHVEFFS